MIAGKRSDVGATFKKGGSRRNNLNRRQSDQVSLCVGVGSEYSKGLNNGGAPDINKQNPLPSLIWPKVPEKGHGVKSGIGKDYTFAKGGHSRNFASQNSHVSPITARPMTSFSRLNEMDDFTFSAADRMLHCATPTYDSNIYHGIESAIGFECSVPKGGKRTYRIPDNPVPFMNRTVPRSRPCTAGIASSDSAPPSTSSTPSTPLSAPIRRVISHIKFLTKNCHGVRSTIGNDVTFQKRGHRRIFAGPRSQVPLDGLMEDDLDDENHISGSRSGPESMTSPDCSVCPTSVSPISTCPLSACPGMSTTSSSPTTQMWLDVNTSSYGYGKRSDIGHDITFSKGGSRRNYSAPEPQIELTLKYDYPSIVEEDVIMENSSYEEEESNGNYFESSRPSSAWSRCNTPIGNEGNNGRNNLLENHKDSGIDLISKSSKNNCQFSTFINQISSPSALSGADTDHTNDRDTLPHTPTQGGHLPQSQSGKYMLTHVDRLPQNTTPGIPSDMGGSATASRGKKIFSQKLLRNIIF